VQMVAAEHNPNAMSHPVSWAPSLIKAKSEVPHIKNHTATLVGSKVYVFGGYDNKKNHNNIHLLDCTTYEWDMLRSVRGHYDERVRKTRKPEGRNGHTCTLADGQLWIIGGWLGQGPHAAKDMWVFDISRSQWTQPETYGKSPGPCNMHTTEYIKHLGELFVFRGGDGREYMNDLHSFNIKKYLWTHLAPKGRLPLKRANHASCVVDDKMFIFGGWDGQKRLNDIHVLDTRLFPPSWSTPTSHGEPPSPRAGMTLTNVQGKIFLFGGSGPQNKCYDDLQVYDPSTFTWLKVASIDDGNRSGSGGSVHGGDLGLNRIRDQLEDKRTNDVDGADVSGAPMNMVGAYGEGNPNAEPSGADITVLRKGPAERAGHTATLIGRKLLIYGGSQNLRPNYYNDFFELDTDPPPAVVVSKSSSVQLFQSSLSRFMNKKTFSDITFIVQGRPVYAHRLVLCLMSERFRGMFNAGFREENEREIMINDISYDAFMLMMEYLYTGIPPDLVVVTGKKFRALAGKEAAGIFEPVATNLGGEDGDDEVNVESDDSEIDDEDSDIEDLDDLDDVANEAERRELNNNAPLVDAQRGAFAEMKINNTNLVLIAELMEVADRYMLDHLKQTCEKSLQQAITFETVDALYLEAERCNAPQLKSICEHFKRNYHENEEALLTE